MTLPGLAWDGMAWDGMGMTCTACVQCDFDMRCSKTCRGKASVVAPLQVPVIKLGVIVETFSFKVNKDNPINSSSPPIRPRNTNCGGRMSSFVDCVLLAHSLERSLHQSSLPPPLASDLQAT